MKNTQLPLIVSGHRARDITRRSKYKNFRLFTDMQADELQGVYISTDFHQRIVLCNIILTKRHGFSLPQLRTDVG